VRRPVLRLASLTAAALLLSGCTGEDEPRGESTSVGAREAEEAEAARDTTESLRAAAGEDAEEQPVTATLPVLGTRATTAGATALEIDLNDVSVNGEVMTVLFTVRNVGEAGGNWQIGGHFDDGSPRAPLDDEGTPSEESSILLLNTTDGVTVTDTANGMLHRAAYDTSGSCVCSVDLSNHFVGPGEAIVLTTSFAAPPEDVDTVTVQIPGAGSFDGVAVSR
jgi:hypothetical protein